MSSASTSPANIPLEDSIPEAGASLESILCTEELQRRPSRPPDYEKENCALVALVSALADSPSTVLQTLAKTILDITQCDSAGLSLLTRDGKKPDVCGKKFYWPAIAGMWNPHVGGGTPRNFGPCGDVLDQNRTLLFRHFERRYPYLMPVIPAAEECLLVPFYVTGQAVGTIWAIMHSDRRKFDAEDDRVMASLGKFASSAYQALVHIEDLKFQVAEREKAEAAVRELANGLQAKFRCLVEANIMGIFIWNLEGKIVEANEAFLHIVEYNREDLVSGRIRWTDLTPPEWRDRDEHAVAELKALGSAKPYEKEYLQKGGNRVPVLIGGALFQGGGNEGVAFVLDLSEQKRAEQKIREQEMELRQMLDFTPQHVTVLGPDGKRLYNNQAALDYYGLTLEEWRAYDTRRFFHPDDLERMTSGAQIRLLGGSPHEVEARLLRKDGKYRWFLIRRNPLRDEQGRITRWYAAATDIEDRKQTEQQLQNENVALREEIDRASMFEEIVGTSPALQTVLSRVSKVAPTDSSVLITGETGTGKELVARAIHRRSHRSSRAFVSVNCAAVPRDLITSELFGHEKGAFTGATQRRLGRFELAEGGTIFLDEIGELPAETQIALLRVLQEHEFDRVGGTGSIRTNVRVIAATNRDLEAAIAAGTFRSDLFYRLNVFPIEVPPLRERKEDIPVLVEYFIDRYASKAGKSIRGVNKKSLELLQSYPWPGNIRELQNVIERSVIVCDTENFSVDESWLSRQPLACGPKTYVELARKPAAKEKEIIEAALRESGGRVYGPSGAASKLGIPRSTLESKIRSLKISKSHFKAMDSSKNS